VDRPLRTEKAKDERRGRCLNPGNSEKGRNWKDEKKMVCTIRVFYEAEGKGRKNKNT